MGTNTARNLYKYILQNTSGHDYIRCALKSKRFLLPDITKPIKRNTGSIGNKADLDEMLQNF